MADFEAVLKDVGEFGPFQVRLFLLVSMFETPAAWALFLNVFAAAKPDWRCLTYDGDNTSHVDSYNASVSNASAACTDSGQLCDGIVYTSDFTSIVSEWGLLCQEYVTSLITSVQMVGVLIGACITGQLADTFGRRRILYAVYTLMLISVFLSAFSNSWQLYMVMRFFVGLFFGGTMVVNFVLPMEFVGRQWRTFCGCIGFWACGVMTLPLLAYLFRDWRHLTIACAVGGVPILFSWWYVLESPRWLLQKGRMKEAEVLVRQIAKCNKTALTNRDFISNCDNRHTCRVIQIHKYSYWDLFRNFEMSKNTLVVMYAWFVSCAVYYGMTFNASQLSGDRYINVFLSGLVEIPAILFVVLVNNRFGRKWTQFWLFSLSSVCSLGIFIANLAGVSSDADLILTLALVGKCGISGGWAAAQVFSAELFPTVVRNIGIGASSMMARIGGVVAPQILRLNDVSPAMPFVVFGLLSLVVALSMLIVPETAKKPLPDNLPDSSCCLCLTRSSDMEKERRYEKTEPNGTASNLLEQSIPLSAVKHTESDVVDV